MNVDLPDTHINMNQQTLSPTPASPRSVSNSKTSASSKTTSTATTKKTKTKKEKTSATEKPEVKEKLKKEKKVVKEHRTPEEKERRKKEKEEKKREKQAKEDAETCASPKSVIPEAFNPETPEEKARRRKEKKEKKLLKKDTESKSSSSPKTSPATPKTLKVRKTDKKAKQLPMAPLTELEAVQESDISSFSASMASSVTQSTSGQEYQQQQQFYQQQPMLSMNRVVPEYNYSEHVGPRGMVIHPPGYKSGSSVMDCADDDESSAEKTVEASLHQQKFLLTMVKTLTKKVEKAEAKILRLDEKNAQMEGLAVKLTQTEEQLEYATEENNDFAVRVHALEQALLMQETELDNALDTIREQKQARKQRLESEKGTNPFDDETNPFAGDEVDDQLANRQELAAVRKELDSLRYERDIAVERATNVSIQLAELRAETDETRDQLIECMALIEHLKARRQSSSNSVGSNTSKLGFLWAKRDSKSVKSTAAEAAMIDATEESESVASGEWPRSDHSGDVTYNVGRRRDATSIDLVL
jgi:hypothetical protein